MASEKSIAPILFMLFKCSCTPIFPGCPRYFEVPFAPRRTIAIYKVHCCSQLKAICSRPDKFFFRHLPSHPLHVSPRSSSSSCSSSMSPLALHLKVICSHFAVEGDLVQNTKKAFVFFLSSMRLTKLEMLKRRGKGPPKKGKGKRASKRK